MKLTGRKSTENKKMTERHLFNMPETKESVLIGISGGPDSMALLDMCRQKGIRVHAAHVNYQIRQSAYRDEKICRDYCQKHHIPLSVKRVRYEGQGNFEEWARNIRFRYFRTILKKYDCACLLLAHQRDDLLETYLMQKEKGSIPLYWGLKEETDILGMRVIRPLLSYDKKDLVSYCESNAVSYGLDETNEDEKYRRNAIRLTVLSDYTDKQKEELLIKIKEDNRRLLTEQEKTEEAMQYLQPLRKKEYLMYPENARLQALRQYLIRQDLDVRHVQNAFFAQIDQKIKENENGIWDFSDKQLYLSYGRLSVHKPAESYCVILKDIKETETDYFLCTGQGEGTQGVFVSEKDLPLTIRNFQEGDCLKMRFGTKKVSRYFIDRKIDLYRRKSWPVVLNCRSEIILVPGLGCDKDHYAPEYNLYVIPKES